MKTDKPILVYGYGNPGRSDDGLGPAFIEKVEQTGRKFIETESAYQLNIEDAALLQEFNTVIFVDAEKNLKQPYSFKKLDPALEIAFSTHALNPGSVLALSNDLFNIKINAYLLTIAGYSWEFMAGLTQKAQKNLEAAFDFFSKKILTIK